MKTNEAQTLISMKEQLDEATIDLARLDGRREDLLKRLKEKSGHNVVKKAFAVLVKLQKKLKVDKLTFSEGITALEEDYEW